MGHGVRRRRRRRRQRGEPGLRRSRTRSRRVSPPPALKPSKTCNDKELEQKLFVTENALGPPPAAAVEATAVCHNLAATGPHVDAYQHGIIYRARALSPSSSIVRAPTPSTAPFQPARVSAPAYIAKELEQRLFGAETALAPPAAAAQAGLQPEVELAPVSKKELAHAARAGAGTARGEAVIRTNNFIINVSHNNHDVCKNPKSKSRETNRVLSELIKVHGRTSLGRKLSIYDGRKSLCTAGSLPFESEKCPVTLVGPEMKEKERTEREYKIAINFAGRTDLYHFRQFLCRRQGDMPQETIQVLSVVLRESPPWNYVPLCRYFFSTTFGHGGDAAERLECWRRYYQSLHPAQIDILATSFFPPVTEMPFVQLCLKLHDVSGPLYSPIEVIMKPESESRQTNRKASLGGKSHAYDGRKSPCTAEKECISESTSSNTAISNCKIQILIRMLSFETFPIICEGCYSVQQVVVEAFAKKNLYFTDVKVEFNGRPACLEDSICFLNKTAEKECDMYIGHRIRGGSDIASSSYVGLPIEEQADLPLEEQAELPSEELAGFHLEEEASISLEEIAARLGDQLFDVVFFTRDLQLSGKVPHFVSLGVAGIGINDMIFDLLESFHEKDECVGHFSLSDLRFNSHSRKLTLRSTVGKVKFSSSGYFANMSDAGDVVSEIFKYDQTRVHLSLNNIHVAAGKKVASSKLPKFVQLLVYDLKDGIKSYPGAGIDKRRRLYFRHHLSGLTAAERFAFWMNLELFFEYLGGEKEFDQYFNIGTIPDWYKPLEWSTAYNLAHAFRPYDTELLGGQWSNVKNWLIHARENTSDQVSGKQAEAHAHMIFEWLMYQVRLELSFRGAVITWNSGPIPPEPPVVCRNSYYLPRGAGKEPLKFSNDFTIEELLNINGTLRPTYLQKDWAFFYNFL